MSDDELGYEPASAPLSSRRKTAIWAATGLLGIAAVGVAIVTEVGGHQATASTTVAAGAPTVASSSSPAPAPSGSAAPKRGGGKNGGPRSFGGPGGFGGLGGFGAPGAIGGKTLHSEATVETAKGTTEIVDTQNGKITAVSGSTVTVTSTDNVAFTYTVTSTSRLIVVTAATAGGKPTVNAKATVADLKVGDTVNVTAVRSGDTRTVSSLADGLATAAAGAAGHFGGPGGGFGGGPRPHGTAAPSPKASTAAGAATT